jgi:hypothetical protein
MIRFIYLIAAALLTACGLASAIAADPPKPATKTSLDDELLKGLGNDLTKELDNLPSLKPAVKSSDGKAKGSPSTVIDGEDLGQPGEDQDPFNRIARRMRQVESQIAQDQSGFETQQKQKQIVDDLAVLIEKLNKQCQCSGGECKPGDKSQQSQRSTSKSKEPSAKVAKNPATDSGDRLRNDVTAKATADAIRQNMKDAWGNLPERLREQMLQTSVDEFLPKYELMIEQYFKRLAEEELPNSIEPQRRRDAKK